MKYQRPLPHATMRTLLALARPGARLLIVSDECYLLHRKEHKHLSSKVYDLLLDRGWMSAPQAYGGGIAESTMTAAGHAPAHTLEQQ